MSLKIISDGTVHGTKVVDAETGKALDNITDIRWHISATGLAEASIQFTLVPVEIDVKEDKLTETFFGKEKIMSFPNTYTKEELKKIYQTYYGKGKKKVEEQPTNPKGRIVEVE